MDKLIFSTKHTCLYFNTLEIGLIISYMRQSKIFSIKLLVFEFQIFKWGLIMDELYKVKQEIRNIEENDLSITYKQLQILELIAEEQAKIIDLLKKG